MSGICRPAECEQNDGREYPEIPQQENGCEDILMANRDTDHQDELSMACC